MLKNKRILFVILMVFLMILIPNSAKASDEIIVPNPEIGVTIPGINVIIPVPILVGDKQASFNDIKVKTVDGKELEVVEVIWYKFDYDENSEMIEDSVLVADVAKGFYDGAVGERFEAKEFEEGKGYAVKITYRRPREYLYMTGFNKDYIYSQFPVTNFDTLGVGESEYAWDSITCVVGYPNVKIKKHISKVDITVPTPVIGQKQSGLKDVIVKIDDSETLEVIELRWYKYNTETKEYEEQTILYSEVMEQIYYEKPTGEKIKIKDFEEGAKYKLDIMYRRPNKYGYSDDLNVKVNGNNINTNDFKEFTAGNIGEIGYDWDRVSYEFGIPKKYEPVDDKDKESDKDTNLGTEAEKGKEETKKEETKKEETKKEDATKAGGTIPYTGGEVVIILSAIAIIGLGIYLYRKNKDLKGI